ncbi:hypothetical protein ACMFMG_002716 [Clarireedia jacksonii]
MSCQLKPSASAFSAMLSAFIGSVINGLSSGWFVAIMTGWIAWFALFRVILGAVYMMYRSVTGTWEPEYDAIRQAEHEGSHPMAGQSNSNQEDLIISGPPPSESHQSYGRNSMGVQGGPVPQSNPSKPGFLSVLWPSTSDVFPFKLQATKSTKNIISWGSLNRDVTFLGWVGWIWTGLIAPISQLIWVAANISNRSNGPVKIVKGLTVAVTALPLNIDSRIRYGEALAGSGNRRPWAKLAFNLTNCLSCLLQGAVNISHSSTFGFPTPILVIYPIFSLIWMYGSLVILPVRDGGRRRAAQKHWSGYILDIGMGGFAGIFLAAPAFGIYQSTSFDEKYGSTSFDETYGGTSNGADGQTLAQYLQCETQVWKKFAAVFP